MNRGAAANALKRIRARSETESTQVPLQHDGDPESVERDIEALLHAPDPTELDRFVLRLARTSLEHLETVVKGLEKRLSQSREELMREGGKSSADRSQALIQALADLGERLESARRARRDAAHLKEHPEQVLKHYIERARPLFPNTGPEHPPQPRAPAPPATHPEAAPTPEQLTSVIEAATRAFTHIGREPARSLPADARLWIDTLEDDEKTSLVLGWVRQCRENGWQVEFDLQQFQAPKQGKRRTYELKLLHYAFIRHGAKLRKFYEVRLHRSELSQQLYREWTNTFGFNALCNKNAVGCAKGTLLNLQFYQNLKTIFPNDEQLHPTKLLRHDTWDPDVPARTEQARREPEPVDPAEEQKVLAELDEVAHLMQPGLAKTIRKMYDSKSGAMTLRAVKQHIRDVREQQRGGRRGRRPRW